MTAPALSLVVPGLLGPWPAAAANALPGSAVAALCRLLSRAQSAPLGASGFEATLCQLFGLLAESGRDLPLAALRRLSDAGDADGYWLCADPVHLRADLNQVVLAATADELAIERGEAAQLAAAFNATFADDGLHLDTPDPHRWYLRLDQPARIITTPLAEARGRNINPLLPRGADAGRWHTLLTEIQMLLHGNPVNAAREAAGRTTINCLWLWGGGDLPTGLAAPAAECYAAGAVARGLIRQAGLAQQAPPADAADWQAGNPAGDQFVVLEGGRALAADGDFGNWSHWLETLAHDWLAPLENLLRHGRLSSLTLYPCDQRVFRVNRRGLARIWRRPRPLAGFLQQP